LNPAMSEERDKKMSVGERDKNMSDIASIAAEAFCERYDAAARNERDIKIRPQEYRQTQSGPVHPLIDATPDPPTCGQLS
jgi:hypothetical protein